MEQPYFIGQKSKTNPYRQPDKEQGKDSTIYTLTQPRHTITGEEVIMNTKHKRKGSTKIKQEVTNAKVRHSRTLR